MTKKNRIFRLISALALSLAIGTTALHAAEPVPDIIWQFHQIRLLEYQRAVVVFDMQLMLLGGDDRPTDEQLKVGSIDAIGRLDKIAANLKPLRLHQELELTQKVFLDSIESLQHFYRDLDKESDDDRMAQWKAHQNDQKQFHEYFESVILKHRITPEVEEGFEWKVFEANMFSEIDRDVYKNGVSFYDQKQWNDAYSVFEKLSNQITQSHAKQLLKLKMADTLKMGSEGIERIKNPDEKIVSLLAEIIDDPQYNHILFEAFSKWRAFNQRYYHGASNWSVIPNDSYEEKRVKIYQILKNQIIDDPNDWWARVQTELLLRDEIIERGTYGNTAIYDIVRWYEK